MGTVTEQLEARVRALIADDCKPGAKLPSERQIAEDSGASRTTVRLVLAKLAAQGIIEAQHGRGYFVAGEVDTAPPAVPKVAQE